MTQAEYRKKRDFQRTPEPLSKRKQREGKIKTKVNKRIFVVQEHHATHLHYDFRLEAFGTLKSWAVPKGPSTKVGDKRLAVQVEDHPLSYASFSGRIPAGEYGAGLVKIWDKGSWLPPKNLRQAFKEGHIEFELEGKKLKGRWILIRTGPEGENEKKWLLIKGHDQSKKQVKDPKRSKGRKAAFPQDIQPQLAILASEVPRGAHWIHEIKLDGYRTFAHIDRGRIRMLSRNSLDWTEKYSELANSLRHLKAQTALLDGEVIVRDALGRSSFNELQRALKHGKSDFLEYCVFDLLYLNGRDLRSESLYLRKTLLQGLLQNSDLQSISYSEHFQSSGEELFRKACQDGLEGIISKDLRKPYEMARTAAWIKNKCTQRQEFLIAGYTDPGGARPHFGALLLGVYEGKTLRFVGKVGTGFDDDILEDLKTKMHRLKRLKNPFGKSYSEGDQGVRWVKPELIAEVEFRAWTAAGLLRQASFVGLRTDKSAKEIRREEPRSLRALSHPDRVLFAESQTTKLDVASYYKSVAPWFLVHAANRPLSLLRCTELVGSECFFQKHLGNMRADDVGEGRVQDQEFIYIDSTSGLLQLVQAGALEFHLWQSHLANAEKPDQIVFDLDPSEELPWGRVVKAAFQLKDLLDKLLLKSFVKTTGGKGLHVHVPIAADYGFDSIKEFARIVCRYLEKGNPSLYTLNMSKKVRSGKIYLDYHRNGFGATAIAPYSLRAKDHPYVAVPLSWSELRAMHTQKNFDWKETLQRLASAKTDVWPAYAKLQQRIRILDKAGVSLGTTL